MACSLRQRWVSRLFACTMNSRVSRCLAGWAAMVAASALLSSCSSVPILPAKMEAVAVSRATGDFRARPKPNDVYGMGLAYADHIKEAKQRADPAGCFAKNCVPTHSGGVIHLPDRKMIAATLNQVEPATADEPGLGEEFLERTEGKDFRHLLDYEAELAFVLLEDVDWKRIDAGDESYCPRMGFFVANDVSLRCIPPLAAKPTKADRYRYWGASKSFPDFLPASKQMWVPRSWDAGKIPDVVLTTEVNGKGRQKKSVTNLIYRPVDMLKNLKKAGVGEPGKGDWVLTGTPGGVALELNFMAKLAPVIPRWWRFSFLQGMDKGGASLYLHAGDHVKVSGGALGSVSSTVQ